MKLTKENRMKNLNPFSGTGVVGRLAYWSTRGLNCALLFLPVLILGNMWLESNKEIELVGAIISAAAFIFIDFQVTKKRIRDVKGDRYEERDAIKYTFGCYVPFYANKLFGELISKKGLITGEAGSKK